MFEESAVSAMTEGGHPADQKVVIPDGDNPLAFNQ
jgi:hypothetical protein